MNVNWVSSDLMLSISIKDRTGSCDENTMSKSPKQENQIVLVIGISVVDDDDDNDDDNEDNDDDDDGDDDDDDDDDANRHANLQGIKNDLTYCFHSHNVSHKTTHYIYTYILQVHTSSSHSYRRSCMVVVLNIFPCKYN